MAHAQNQSQARIANQQAQDQQPSKRVKREVKERKLGREAKEKSKKVVYFPEESDKSIPQSNLGDVSPFKSSSRPEKKVVSRPKEKDQDLSLEGMMDVTSYAGVDLQREENDLLVSNEYSGRTGMYREEEFLDLPTLEDRVLRIGQEFGVTDFSADIATFISLAAESYASTLLTTFCKFSAHRASTFSLPINTRWEIAESEDIREVLEQIKINEIIAIEQINAAMPAIEEVGTEDPTVSQTTSQTGVEKVKKARGSKKDLPEAVKDKLANTAAMLAVGGSVKSWMVAGAGNTYTPVVKPKSEMVEETSVQERRRGREKVQKRVTISDALTAMEGRRELRGGDVLYRYWANIK